MSEEKDQEKSDLKIVDKRRFDTDGTLKDDTSAESSSAESSSAKSLPKESQAKEAHAEKVDSKALEDSGSSSEDINSAESSQQSLAGGQSIDFSSFIMSLATQALMQLGDVPAPPGLEIDKDPGAARQTIDILDMLRKKTAGNLDQSENALFEEILHNLRMSYVRQTKS